METGGHVGVGPVNGFFCHSPLHSLINLASRIRIFRILLRAECFNYKKKSILCKRIIFSPFLVFILALWRCRYHHSHFQFAKSNLILSIVWKCGAKMICSADVFHHNSTRDRNSRYVSASISISLHAKCVSYSAFSGDKVRRNLIIIFSILRESFYVIAPAKLVSAIEQRLAAYLDHSFGFLCVLLFPPRIGLRNAASNGNCIPKVLRSIWRSPLTANSPHFENRFSDSRDKLN